MARSTESTWIAHLLQTDGTKPEEDIAPDYEEEFIFFEGTFYYFFKNNFAHLLNVMSNSTGHRREKTKRNFKFVIMPNEKSSVPTVDEDSANCYMSSSKKSLQIIYRFDECKNIYYGGIHLWEYTTKRVAKSEIMNFFNLNDDIEENYAIVYVHSFKGKFEIFSSSQEMAGHYSYCKPKRIIQTFSIRPDPVVDNNGYVDTSYGHCREQISSILVEINGPLLHQPETFSSLSSIMIGASSEELSIQPVVTPLTISEISSILPDTQMNTKLSTIIPPEIEERYKTFYREINPYDLAASTTGKVYKYIHFVFFSTIRLINMEYLGVLFNARKRQFSKTFI